jgi:glycine/sarcosine N-methyltransferase
MQVPAFYEQDGKSRFVHQVWQWQGEQYALHLYITLETESGWKVKHFDSRYRALRRSDLNQALQTAGFRDIRWLEPETTSFYQPIVIATKRRWQME